MEADRLVYMDTLATVLFTFALFQLFVKRQVTLRLLPDRLSSTSDKWRFRNLFISMIHAFVAAIMATTSLISYPNADPMLETNALFRVTGAFSLGYFLYDAVDIASIEGGGLRANAGMTLHHVMTIFTMLCALALHMGQGYLCIGLLVEFNSFFLHMRKVMHLATGHRSRVVTILNFLTFVVFRLGVLAYLSCVSYVRVTTERTAIQIVLAFALALIDIVNAVLLVRLVKSELFYKPKAKDISHINGRRSRDRKEE